MMKMRLLLAVMASVTALSAQADIKPCRSITCDAAEEAYKGTIKHLINGNYGVKLPSGESISFELLKNAKFEIVKGDKDMFLDLPKGSCEQYYLLAELYSNMHRDEGYAFFKNKLKNKCPSF